MKKYFRGPVWAYLDKPSKDAKIKMGFSPSYSKKVWDEETLQIEKRLERLREEGLKTLKLISVGAFVPNKNQQFILNTCVVLKRLNIPFHLTLVGDGYLKETYQHFIAQNNLTASVSIAGKKTADELRQLYRENDFVLQAPVQEGFGKVPIEGFFHGLIPILSDVALARAITSNNRGFIFSIQEEHSLVELLQNLLLQQADFPAMILNGREFAISQTLEAWSAEYASTILN